MSWVEPVPVIGEVIVGVDPKDDFIAVMEAENAMKQTAQRRAEEAHDMREALRALSRELEAAKVSATRPRTVPSETQHATMIQDMAEQQIFLGKSINETQDLLRSKEKEVNRLRQEERELSQRDEATSFELNSTAIRLQVIAGLGFSVIPESNGDSKRIIVKSVSKDVHAVALEEQSQFDLTNELWRLSSS